MPPLHLPAAPRILIVRLSSIGDVVMATPAARALRRRFPQATIEWLVEPKSAAMVLGNPHLDTVHVMDRSQWGRLFRQGKYGRALLEIIRFLGWLRRQRYHVAIDLQGLLRSGFLVRATGAPVRIGSARARECAWLALTHRVVPRSDPVRAGELCLQLVSLLGVDTSDCDLEVAVGPEHREFARSFLRAHGLEGGFAALCPATTRPQKHWTDEGFARTADLLKAELGLPSLVLGSPADVALAGRICALAAPPPAVAAGKTTLKQAAALLAEAALVVSVDNGPLHLAIAMKRPVVALIGSTTYQRFRDEPGVKIVRHDFPCAPCHRRPTCSDYPCMAAITPQEVLAAATGLLGIPTCA